MSDIRTQIREAFEKEQSAFPPPGALRAQIVAAVSSHAGAAAPARQRADRNLNWLMVGAAVVLAIAIVAGLMAVRLSGPRSIPAYHGPAPQRCVPGPTDPSNRFARVHGCITFSDGTQIVAVDPYHPANRIVLGPSNGRLPLAWSRDGTRLLVMSGNDLYVMNSDGSQAQLTHGEALAWEGAGFSPDGTQVVYVRHGGSTGGLAVVNVSGDTSRVIAADKSYCSNNGTNCFGYSFDYPAWSPNGSRIAYIDYRWDLWTDEIWSMSPDGADQRRLIDLGSCAGLTYGAGCTDRLAWSPDGLQLAYHSPGGIYVMRLDGSSLHRISKDGGEPSWSPDGSRIAFTRGGQLYTMAADGGDATRLEDTVPVPNYAWAWNPVS